MLCASARRMAGRVEKRVAELGLAIPEAAAPAANYVPWVRTGNNMLFISGQIPKQPDNSLLKGTLGATVGIEEGKAAARLCALHLVGQMKAACSGDLDKAPKLTGSLKHDQPVHRKFCNQDAEIMKFYMFASCLLR
ncbi:TCP17 [Symbiodinium microadriaticum]|nr:TCP17 [Symbiodinium microadriaticum]CAE7637731.1 TCP17 [Symbiodinium sp. KB8]